MALHIHNRKQPTEPIPTDVVDALRATYFATRYPSQSQHDAAQAFLKRLRAARLWIACDCPGEDQPPALMAPREPEHAEIHLFQFGQVQHAASCDFARAIERGSQHDATRLQGPLDEPWTIRPFIGAGGLLNARLDQILRAALTRSGIGRIQAADLERGERPGCYVQSGATPAQRVGDAIRHVEIDDHQVYEQAGLHHLRSIAKFAHTEAVRRLARTTGGYVGLAIGMVDEVVPAESGKPSGLVLGGRQGDRFVVYLEQPVTGAETSPKGPYWAAVALCRKETDTALRVLTASVLPALDRLTGIPLTSGAHRAPVRMLLEQAIFWKTWASTQCSVALEFPLYDGVSADAVISTPNGRMVEAYFDVDEPVTRAPGSWGDLPEPVYLKGKPPAKARLQLSAAVAKAVNVNTA